MMATLRSAWVSIVWIAPLALPAAAFQASAAAAAPAHGGRITRSADGEQDIPERFRLDAATFAWTRTPPKQFDSFDTFRVTFPSPVTTPEPQNNTVHCEYFVPKGQGPFPAVIVLHILGGDFELSRVCCRTLASSNVAALFLKMPYYGPRRPPGCRVKMISADPEQSIACMTQAVKDIRRGADWLANRPEIDAERLGITGISLGGIVASLAAAIEPRFQKGCFVLAGGDFPTIVAESTELDDVRAAWAGKEITARELGEMLRPIDPLTYADRLQGRQLLMINARQDKVIPRSCAESLWRAAGQPELIWWNAGHYSAALYLPFGLARIVKFFAP